MVEGVGAAEGGEERGGMRLVWWFGGILVWGNDVHEGIASRYSEGGDERFAYMYACTAL